MILAQIISTQSKLREAYVTLSEKCISNLEAPIFMPLQRG